MEDYVFLKGKAQGSAISSLSFFQDLPIKIGSDLFHSHILSIWKIQSLWNHLSIQVMQQDTHVGQNNSWCSFSEFCQEGSIALHPRSLSSQFLRAFLSNFPEQWMKSQWLMLLRIVRKTEEISLTLVSPPQYSSYHIPWSTQLQPPQILKLRVQSAEASVWLSEWHLSKRTVVREDHLQSRYKWGWLRLAIYGSEIDPFQYLACPC